MSSIYNFLPPDYRLILQPEDKTKKALLTAILDSISEQDDKNVDLLVQAKNQMFLSTAEGKYLIDLAAQNGFTLPQRSGLDQAGISALAIPVINKPKQLLSTLNHLTEIVYSSNILHPSFDASSYEPYSLADGDTLSFETESGTANIVIRSQSFSDITNVYASELAGYINAQQIGTIFADSYYDRIANKRKLRISSTIYGHSARLRCTGGTAQNILKFPSMASTNVVAGTVFDLTKIASYNDILTITWNGTGTDPQFYNLDMGDVCTIRGLTNGTSILNGTYTVLDCGANYFVIKNSYYRPVSSNITATSSGTMVFTKSYSRSIYDNDQYAVNYEPNVGSIVMSIPPIPSIVRRAIKGSMHAHGISYLITGVEQNTVTVQYPNVLPESGGIMVYNSLGFNLGYNDRYYKYTGKLPPSGSEQKLVLDLSYKNLPLVSEASAATMKTYADPFYAELDSNIYSIYCPGMDLSMENNIEFVLNKVSFNRSAAKSTNNIYTVDSILLPTTANQVDFIHNRNSKYLYMQFTDSLSGEILYCEYKASILDPVNRTTIMYGNNLKGRAVTATIVVCQTSFPPPANEATLVMTRAITAGSGSVTLTHNMGTSNVMFTVMNADTGDTVVAERYIIDNNNVRFDYVNIIGGNYAFLFINMDIATTPVPDPDTNPRRYKTSITLSSSATSYTLTHSLRAANLIVEFKKTGGLPSLTNGTELEFIHTTVIDQNTIRIDYRNLFANMNLDVFIVYDVRNSSTESVDGGLSLVDINNTHVVRQVGSKDRIYFEINDSTGMPKPYQGAVISGFDVVLASDIYGSYDCALRFATPLARLDARLVNGTKIRLTNDGGVVSGNESAAEILRTNYLSVISQSNNMVYLKSGAVINPASSTIIAGAKLRSSANFGGSGVYFTVSPTSAYNKANVYNTPTASLVTALQYPTNVLTPTNSGSTQTAAAGNPDIVDVSSVGYVGPYVYDVTGTSTAFTIGGANGIGILQDTIQLSSSPGRLRVQSLDGFSSSGGYLCVDHGSYTREGPIRYTGTLDTGLAKYILIDNAYTFKKKHLSGVKIHNLRSIYRYSPSNNAKDYPLYLTGAIDVRNSFIGIVNSIIASGVVLTVDVQQPSIKYKEPGISIF
jgi:hypothetical protein